MGKDDKTEIHSTECDSDKVLEYLYNIVQDAQASGSIVHLVTIFPPGVCTDESRFSMESSKLKSCKPKAETCPK